MTVSMHRVQAVLKLPTTAPDLIVRARAIVDAMTANSWFPAPVPSLAAVRAAVDRLESAETAAFSGKLGLKEVRNEARAALIGLLNRLRVYVQGIADENPDSAPAIIESAAMSIKGHGNAPKPVLAVFQGRVSGSVRLVAKAASKLAKYDWQLSKDGGKSWVDLPTTLQAKMTVSELAPGLTHSFRVRALTRRGAGDWCDPVSEIVK